MYWDSGVLYGHEGYIMGSKLVMKYAAKDMNVIDPTTDGIDA